MGEFGGQVSGWLVPELCADFRPHPVLLDVLASCGRCEDTCLAVRAAKLSVALTNGPMIRELN